MPLEGIHADDTPQAPHRRGAGSPWAEEGPTVPRSWPPADQQQQQAQQQAWQQAQQQAWQQAQQQAWQQAQAQQLAASQMMWANR